MARKKDDNLQHHYGRMSKTTVREREIAGKGIQTTIPVKSIATMKFSS